MKDTLLNELDYDGQTKLLNLRERFKNKEMDRASADKEFIKIMDNHYLGYKGAFIKEIDLIYMEKVGGN